jgi:histidyl-tRNA synthetase
MTEPVGKFSILEKCSDTKDTQAGRYRQFLQAERIFWGKQKSECRPEIF